MIDACESSDTLIGLYAPTYDLVRLITAPRITAKLTEHGIAHNYNKSENVIYTSAPRFGDFILGRLIIQSVLWVMRLIKRIVMNWTHYKQNMLGTHGISYR